MALRIALVSLQRRALPLLLVVLAGPLCGCGYVSLEGPQPLLETTITTGALPRMGQVTTGGEMRAALLASAGFRVRLPRRPLLTYGLGVVWAGPGEPPGWFRFTLKIDGKRLDQHTLNPRAARGFRDVSFELKDLGPETLLEFELRLTDRDGHDIPQPAELLLAVAEPTLHDLDAYGRSKGVLLISIDTLRRDHVGLHGYPLPTTPTLDALGARGLVAEDAVSVSSWTLPAHLSLLTSVDPGRHGGTDMRSGFNRSVPTLPSLLRAAGYATQAVTSHLYVSSTYGLDEGFDHLNFRQDRKAGETADRAIHLLDRLGDRAFFLFLHFYDPHWHYDPPDYARELFDTGYQGELTGLWRDFKDRGPDTTSPTELSHLLSLYDGEVRYTDDQVGRILAHLRARGLERSTLVLVTSDHGEEFLEHGSWEHQKTLFEEVVRIPLIVAGSGIAPRREPAPVGLLDVAPTILAWAGLEIPEVMSGRSLLGPVQEREMYGETDHTLDRTPLLFLRAGQRRWKALFALDPAGRVQKSQWYDLAADPEERSSAPPPPAVAEAVRARAVARWKTMRQQGGPTRKVELSEAETERLRALGYVDP